MKIKLLLAGVLVAGGLSIVPVAYAVTPTFSLSGVGGDAVSITVAGDANSSAVLFYNVDASTGRQVSILGMTDTAGGLSKSLSVSGLGLNTANTVYVMVNSQQSAVQQWSNTGSAVATVSPVASAATTATTAGAVTFSQNNLSVPVGGTINVTITSTGIGYYVSASSNLGVTIAAVNDKSITITGLANGTNAITICSAVANVCGILNVTVGATSGTVTPTTVTPTVVTTPAPVVTATALPTSLNTTVSLLTTIQTMQSQLAQMLLAIQTMQTQLAQIVSSMATTVSGTVTPAPAQFNGTFSSFLKLNSTGSEVTALQQKLIKEGFLAGSATGTFGPLTEAALKKYQTANGVDPVGYVGPSTRAILNIQ